MRLMVAAALVVALSGLSGVRADEKNNPTGTWKWEVEFQGQKREQTLKLKLEGDKLTGALVGRNNQETPIEDGKFKDGEVSFKITRERNGQKFVQVFTGKVDGDTLKGKMGREGREGREIEAKRAKD